MQKIRKKKSELYQTVFNGRRTGLGPGSCIFLGERELFEQIYNNLLWKAKIPFIQSLMQFYVRNIKEESSIESQLTEKQKVLYWFKEF